MLAPGSRYSIVAIIDHPVDFDHKKASLPKVAYNYVIKKYISKKSFLAQGREEERKSGEINRVNAEGRAIRGIATENANCH